MLAGRVGKKAKTPHYLISIKVITTRSVEMVAIKLSTFHYSFVALHQSLMAFHCFMEINSDG